MSKLQSKILEYLSEKPNEVCYVTDNVKYTKEELISLINYLKNYMRIKNNGTKKIIVLIMNNSVHYIASYFMAILEGHIVFPVYRDLNIQELRDLSKKISINYLITDREEVENDSEVVVTDGRIFTGNIKDDMSLKDFEVSFNPIVGEAIGSYLMTSGSTNSPKIVMHSHKNLMMNCEMHNDSILHFNEHIYLAWLPFPFGYSTISVMLSAVLNNGKIISGEKYNNPAVFFKSIQDYNINQLVLVPAVINNLIKFAIKERIEIKSDINICIGGTHITKNKIIELKKIFINSNIYYTYGQTELGPRVSTKYIESTDNFTHKNVGTLLNGITCDIRNIHEGIGEIWIDSPTKMTNYLNDYQYDLNYLDTGDLGFFKDNELFIVGRKKNIAKISGFLVYPEEIEEILSPFLDVPYYIITEMNNEMEQELVLKIESDSLDKSKVYSYLRKHVSHFKVPKKIYLIAEFTRTKNGKIIRE